MEKMAEKNRTGRKIVIEKSIERKETCGFYDRFAILSYSPRLNFSSEPILGLRF